MFTRSITLDIVDMSKMGRQYNEVCESVLPNVPKIDCLVSKFSLAFKMIQLILLYSCFLFVKVLTRVWALYHRSKSLCLLLSTNKKPDFSDAQSYMRYLSEDLFSPI